MAQVSGRLTRDAQVRTGKHGKEFLTFTVAENYDYKKDDTWVKKAAYFNCTYSRSSKVAALLTKGTFVIVSGEMSIREYTTNDETKTGLQLRISDLKIPTGSAKKKITSNQEEKKEPAEDLPF